MHESELKILAFGIIFSLWKRKCACIVQWGMKHTYIWLLYFEVVLSQTYVQICVGMHIKCYCVERFHAINAGLAKLKEIMKFCSYSWDSSKALVRYTPVFKREMKYKRAFDQFVVFICLIKFHVPMLMFIVWRHECFFQLYEASMFLRECSW